MRRFAGHAESAPGAARGARRVALERGAGGRAVAAVGEPAECIDDGAGRDGDVPAASGLEGGERRPRVGCEIVPGDIGEGTAAVVGAAEDDEPAVDERGSVPGPRRGCVFRRERLPSGRAPAGDAIASVNARITACAAIIHVRRGVHARAAAARPRASPPCPPLPASGSPPFPPVPACVPPPFAPLAPCPPRP